MLAEFGRIYDYELQDLAKNGESYFWHIQKVYLVHTKLL